SRPEGLPTRRAGPTLPILARVGRASMIQPPDDPAMRTVHADAGTASGGTGPKEGISLCPAVFEQLALPGVAPALLQNRSITSGPPLEVAESVDGGPACDLIRASGTVPTNESWEEMKHPSHVWTDPSYAEESLSRLCKEYVEYLEGRA